MILIRDFTPTAPWPLPKVLSIIILIPLFITFVILSAY